MANSKYGRKVAPWKWASGATRKRSFGQTNISDDVPVSRRHGRRYLGQVDISDMPKDVDARALMPLPWECPHCHNMLLHRPQSCSRCGTLTPVGQWLVDYGRA